MPLCENPIIYYVFSTSKTLIFLKSNENLIIYYVLELPDKPVSARNGKRVEKKKVYPKVAQECPRSDFNAPKVTSESPQSGSRCSQNEPKCSQVVPQGLSRPPKIDQKRSPRPSRDTFKKTNVSALREPHYLLCF